MDHLECQEEARLRAQMVWDAFKHEDEAVAQRTDWFLIFHAILLEAYFAAIPSQHELPVAVFGVLSAYLWFIVGLRQWWAHKHLRRALEDDGVMTPLLAQIFAGTSAVRSRHPLLIRWPRATPVFTWMVPSSTLILWSYFVISPRPRDALLWVALLAPVVFYTTMLMLVRNKPKIPPADIAALRAERQDPDSTAA